MKLGEAKKLAKAVGTARDPHGSASATAKIISDICGALNLEFSEFEFWLTESGEVGVEKKVVKR